MIEDNSTRYFIGGDDKFSELFPFKSGCMALTTYCEDILNIIVPYTSLNDKLSEKDVYRWVEIGNSLIFPATIRKGTTSGIHNFNFSDYFRRNRTSITIANPNENRFDYNKMMDEGFILSISFNGLTKRDLAFSEITKFNKNLPRDYGKSRYQSVWTNDYKISKTGEPLTDFIDSIKKAEVKKYKDNENNCFVISLDLRNEKKYAPLHKLSILTFYRYLYSDYYKGIVSNTLRLVDMGVDPWTALMFSHVFNHNSYNNYYGLTPAETRRMPLMDSVLSLLNRGKSINYSFGNADGFLFNNACPKKVSINSIKEFNEFMEKYKGIEVSNGKTVEFSVVCISSKGTKTLKEGKKYSVSEVDQDKIKVTDDTYAMRWYNYNRFKLI